jgi:hypothetical protein
MRTLIVLTGLAVLGACTTYPDKTKPPVTEQSDAIETACGTRPVSKLRGSRSPSEVIYSACRREILKATRTIEGRADAN